MSIYYIEHRKLDGSIVMLGKYSTRIKAAVRVLELIDDTWQRQFSIASEPQDQWIREGEIITIRCVE